MRVRRHLEALLAATALGGTGACDHSVVCDPLPAPVDCRTTGVVDREVKASASWVEDGGLLDASVSVYIDGPAIVVEGGPTASGGTLVGTPTLDALSVSFSCRPDDSATSMSIDLRLRCDPWSTGYRLTLDLSQPAAAGSSIPTTVTLF